MTVAAAAVLLGMTPMAWAKEPVDVELVLAVDVSLSMSPAELKIQRDGYAAALTDQAVLDAIASGAHGKIAITYFEWAGQESQTVLIPWTVIANRQDAEAVARHLTVSPSNGARRTSISAAISFGVDLLAESGFEGMKRVIDISGDGPNNNGAPVVEMRDAAVNQGIVINGLPLMTTGGFSSAYDVANLDAYYEHCVIGGPGAFMVPVNSWEQFPEAIRRKLVLELASRPLQAIPAQFLAQDTPPATKDTPATGVDCLMGEKMWRNRSWMWDRN